MLQDGRGWRRSLRIVNNVQEKAEPEITRLTTHNMISLSQGLSSLLRMVI